MDRIKALNMNSDEMKRALAIELARKNFVQRSTGDKLVAPEIVVVKPTDRMVKYSAVGKTSEEFLKKELIARSFQSEQFAVKNFTDLRNELKALEMSRVEEKYSACDKPTLAAHKKQAETFFEQQSTDKFVALVKVVRLKPAADMIRYSAVSKHSKEFLKKELIARGFNQGDFAPKNLTWLPTRS